MINKSLKNLLLTLALTFSSLSASVYAETVSSDNYTEYGNDAYNYLKYLTDNFSNRTNEENNRSEALNNAGLWIESELSGMGYEVLKQDYVHLNFTGTNYFVTRPGKSEKTIVVGAHYDCVSTQGADDNGSGVATVLELAKEFADADTPCSLMFVFYDNEEYGGYTGSYNFVTHYLKDNDMLDDILCCINIDSIAAGDKLFAYGGDYEDDKLVRSWVYDEAMFASKALGVDLNSLPEEVTMFQTPIRPKGSDQYYFNEEGIPYVYFEASLWYDEAFASNPPDTFLTCHFQTADEACQSTGGQIMHTDFDNLDKINELFPGRAKQHLTDANTVIAAMLNKITPDLGGEEEAESSSEAESISESTSEPQITEEETSESASAEEEVLPSDHSYIKKLLISSGIVVIIIIFLAAVMAGLSDRNKTSKKF